MCGRFTQRYTWREVHDLYGLTGAARNLQAHYNIAPTDTVNVVRPADSGVTEFVPMRWGLVPWWWKKPLKQLPASFNAPRGGHRRQANVPRRVNKTGTGDDDPTVIAEIHA